MNAQEFSNEFDALYNNVSSNQAPGLTEYEKSVFLTKAQNEIIKNYFTNVQGGNKYQQGISDSEKRFADFSALLSVATLNAEKKENVTTFDPRGVMFRLPDGSKTKEPKAMIIIDEAFTTAKTKTSKPVSYQVIPLQFDEYKRLMSKPSSDPLKHQAWKLMGNNEFGNGTVEIVPHWKDKDNTFNQLILKYIRKPHPIILEDLTPQGLSIEGYSDVYKVEEYTGVHTIIVKHSDGTELLAAYVANSDVPSKPGLLEIKSIVKKDDGYYLRLDLKSAVTSRALAESAGTVNLVGGAMNKYDKGDTPVVVPGKDPFDTIDDPIDMDEVPAFSPDIRLYSPTVPSEVASDMDELISKLSTYTLSFEFSQTTENVYTEVCCELAEEIHPEILQRAVEIAKVHYSGQTQEIIASGQRSE